MKDLELGPRKIIGIGDFFITETVIYTWIVMILLTIFALVMNKKIKDNPGPVQALLEWYVDLIYGWIDQNMGKHNYRFGPYLCTVFMFLICLNAMGLFGVRPPTADLNAALAFTTVSFLSIHIFAMMQKGFWGHMKHIAGPVPILFPINLVVELAVPVSLTFRLFGNILGGVIIVELLYELMFYLSESVHLTIPIFAIATPIILNLFFDVFEPILQGFIFTILTMVFIGISTEVTHEH